MLSNLLISVSNFSHSFLYTILFLAMIFLGEEALLIFGALSRFGLVNFWDTFLIALAGVFVGDLLWFRIGEEYGEKFVSRYGRWFLMTPLIFQKIEYIIKKSGGLFIFVSKFVYNLNHISLVAAGTVKFDFAKFIKCQIITSIVWTLSFLGLGYFFANNLAAIKHDVKLLAVTLLAVFIGIILLDRLIGRIIEKRIIKLPD